MKEKILLFIPGYNCEKQITRVLNQLSEQVLGLIDEVIVVNNQSSDNTEQAVITFAGNHPHIPLNLLRNNENYGLGGSHKTAFQYAMSHNFDYIIVLHGDDQGSIEDLLPILTSRKYTQYDCCLGARFIKGARLEGYSGFRSFGNRVYNLLFSLCTGKRIYDLGSGLNMYSMKMLEDKFYFRFPDNLTFNYCMILASHFYRHNIIFFPISWREEDQVSNVKLFSQAFGVLKMLARYTFGRKKFIRSELRMTPHIDYTAETICAHR